VIRRTESLFFLRTRDDILRRRVGIIFVDLKTSEGEFPSLSLISRTSSFDEVVARVETIDEPYPIAIDEVVSSLPFSLLLLKLVWPSVSGAYHEDACDLSYRLELNLTTSCSHDFHLYDVLQIHQRDERGAILSSSTGVLLTILRDISSSVFGNRFIKFYQDLGRVE